MQVSSASGHIRQTNVAYILTVRQIKRLLGQKRINLDANIGARNQKNSISIIQGLIAQQQPTKI